VLHPRRQSRNAITGQKPIAIGERLRGLLARAHRNIAIVALANKLARIAWAILRRETRFNLRHLAVTG
jgi:hypothetical protein